MADRVATPRPWSARAHCRRHAFARFPSNVSPDNQVYEYSPRSSPVRYGPHRNLAVDCSVNRYYDPQTGQFLSVDPDLSTTLQPYAYAGDDPVNSVDQMGLGPNPSQCNPNDVQYHACMAAVRDDRAKGRYLFSFVVRLTKRAWARRREVLRDALVTTGMAAAIVCTLATDGICGLAIAELPVGELTVAATVGAVSNAAEYSLSKTHHSLTGYITSAAKGSAVGIILSALPTVGGVVWPAGEHAIPVGFFGTLRNIVSAIK